MLRLSSNLIATISAHESKQIAHFRKRSQDELAGLSPSFAGKVTAVIQQLGLKGWVPVVYHGKRTRAEQAKKVAAGYSRTMNSLHVPDTKVPKGRNGLYWNVCGEAADVVDARYLWSGPASDLKFAFWLDLGVLAKEQGLLWGGDWPHFKDVAHVERITRLEITQDSRGSWA